MGRKSEEPRPWSADAGCPVGLVQQIWIETSMHWFIDQFGKDVALGEVVLPTPGSWPAPYSGTPEQISLGLS
jgi:hypothetical protein